MLTNEQRAEINRANAQKSTGPKTEAGKQKVRLNATRHNITGQTIIMFEADLEIYQQFKKSFFEYHAPVGPVENQCVQTIVDASWKMNECTAWQSCLLASRSIQRVHRYPAENNPQVNEALAIADSVALITRDLANLSVYEQRHFRTLEKSLDRLASMQKLRKEQEALALSRAAALLELHEREELDRLEARDEQVQIAAKTGQPSPGPYVPQLVPPAHEPLPELPALSEPVLKVDGFVFSLTEIKELSARKTRLKQAVNFAMSGSTAG